jgi:hypothetical protein
MADEPSPEDPKIVELFAGGGHKRGGRSFGGSGGGDSMEPRIAALEAGMKEISSKLDKLVDLVNAGRLENERRFGVIESRLTGIEAKLDNKAGKADLVPIETRLGAMDGKVGMVPTTAAMIATTLSAVGLSLAGAAGLAFTLFKIFKP